MTQRRKKRYRGKPLRRILQATIVAFFSFWVLVIGGGIYFLVPAAGELPRLENLGERPVALTSKIYAADGRWMADLHAEQDRVPIPLESIPKVVQLAIIAIEDERFYEHRGVDFHGIIRALVANLEQGTVVEGGSTITQQYVKNTYLTSERTLDRKIREASLAIQLERRLGKREILERYLNTIYFGEESYGVATAANRYFGKTVQQLSLAESALLAGIIRAPRNYSPYLNLPAAKARRDQVLRKMFALEYIDLNQAKQAIAEPVRVIPQRPHASIFAPYFVEYVKQQLLKEYGVNAVFRGGLRIRTTLVPRMQVLAEQAVSSTLNRPGDPSASLVAVEPKTGYIRAMVGGTDFQSTKFNLAVQGKRQTGSSFKIFVLTAWVAGNLSLGQTFNSAPQVIPMGKFAEPWKVQNYDQRYRGRITVRSATIWSDNTVYAQMMMRVKPQKVVDYAKAMGITSRLKPYPAIALGGLEYGVSSLEMASAAATLANDGVHVQPIAILRVEDSEGNVLETAKVQAKRAMSAAVSRTVTAVLREAVEKGTGTRARLDRPVAGKTGTAQDYRDAWFVGYTPNLSTAVWMGYPEAQREMRNVHGIRVAGGTFPAMMWKKFMESALKGVKPQNFAPPPAEKLREGPTDGNGKFFTKKKKRKKNRSTNPQTEQRQEAPPVESLPPEQAPAPFD